MYIYGMRCDFMQNNYTDLSFFSNLYLRNITVKLARKKLKSLLTDVLVLLNYLDYRDYRDNPTYLCITCITCNTIFLGGMESSQIWSLKNSPKGLKMSFVY